MFFEMHNERSRGIDLCGHETRTLSGAVLGERVRGSVGGDVLLECIKEEEEKEEVRIKTNCTGVSASPNAGMSK